VTTLQTPEKPDSQTGERNFRWDAAAVALVSMLTALSMISGAISRGIGGVLSPFVQDTFALSYTQIGLIGGVFSLAGLAFSVPLGGMVDAMGVRRSILISQMLMIIGLTGAAYAPTYGVFLAGLFIIGAGRAFLQPGSNQVVVRDFPRRLLATVMGFKQMGVSAGGGLSAILLPWLVLTTSWRASLLLLAVASSALAAIVILFYVEKSSDGSTPERFSLKGVGQLFAHVPLRRFGLVCVLGVGTQMAIETHTMLYLIRQIGMGPVQAGFLIFITGIAATVGRVFWGVLADRVWPLNRRIPLLISFGIASACALTLSFATSSWSFYAVGAVVGLQGLCLLGWNTLQMTIAAELGGRRGTGMATGFVLTAGALGGLLGAPLFGIAVDISGGYATAWYGSAAALVLACLVMLRVRLN